MYWSMKEWFLSHTHVIFIRLSIFHREFCSQRPMDFFCKMKMAYRVFSKFYIWMKIGRQMDSNFLTSIGTTWTWVKWMFIQYPWRSRTCCVPFFLLLGTCQSTFVYDFTFDVECTKYLLFHDKAYYIHVLFYSITTIELQTLIPDGENRNIF